MFGRRLNIVIRNFLLFLLLALSFELYAKDFYVTPNGQPLTVQGSNWSKNVVSLADAVNSAVAGDVIHLLGFTAGEINSNCVYTTSTKDGFALKSGVKVIGGYAPDGTRPQLRNNVMFVYQSVVSADILKNDFTDPITVIYPNNILRSDNANHVFSIDLSGSSHPTMLDGISIMGANAATVNGGGIYCYASNPSSVNTFEIKNCFIHDNYAKLGGGIYVDVNCSSQGSKIINCIVANNVAGAIGVENNFGGGMCLLGAVDVINSVINNNVGGGALLGNVGARIINSTLALNAVAGIDVYNGYTNSDMPDVYNTVMWNNEHSVSFVRKYRPDFYYCASREFVLDDTKHNNVIIDEFNSYSDKTSAFFTVPSVLLGYEFSYNPAEYKYPDSDWSISERSVLRNKGESNIVNQLNVTNDMFGRSRIINGNVDIGAFEADVVDASRIFYVTTSGNNNNDGKSWQTAKRSIQAAIDVAANVVKYENGYAEVWVAEGDYIPDITIEKTNILAFRMRDRVNVYGGFRGTETDKSQREMYGDKMPWQYKYRTRLIGADYYQQYPSNLSSPLHWNATRCRWEGSPSRSSHVVWHAPIEGEKQFSAVTRLEGVTIIGGNATDFSTSKEGYYKEFNGGGIYIGFNSYLENSVVTECVAKNNGGAIYLDGGRVVGSLICSNSALNGGGVFIDNSGLVLRSMILNNGADKGAGVYMRKGNLPPTYLILSTSIVNSNTATVNGAIYCDKGGEVVHCTMTNNNSVGAVDESSPTSPRTGGLYVDGYVNVVNSVFWNNYIQSSPIQLYVLNPSRDKTRFYNTAISNKNQVVWNDVFQQNLMLLSDNNNQPHLSDDIISPNFSLPKGTQGNIIDDNTLKKRVGVLPIFDYTKIYYYWEPSPGSGLRSKGLPHFGYPVDVLIEPQIDLKKGVFAQKPALGAISVKPLPIKAVLEGHKYVVYVDNENVLEGDGSSWSKAYKSLNEVIDFFADLTSVPQGITEFEIRVLEGVIQPSCHFSMNDVKSASIIVRKALCPIRIVGGYSRSDVRSGKSVVENNPILFPTIIHGNNNGLPVSDALYHTVRVNYNAKVIFEGLHIAGANALNDKVKFGAGIMVDDGADVHVVNSMIINCLALGAPALYAPDAKVKMINTVVCNNTIVNGAQSKFDAAVVASDLTLTHCSFFNNDCMPYKSVGVKTVNDIASLCAGNKGSTVDVQIAVNEDNFLNPTIKVGATVRAETYTGGYPMFIPLTSSVDANQYVINKVTGKPVVDTDIMLHPRDLGGVADKGAYEAALPPVGRVYYVRTTADGGNDTNDGLSWNSAFSSIGHALDIAEKAPVVNGLKPEVWVAAGVYSADPVRGSDNCFVIRDGVSVYGAFPPTGSPAKSDRKPLISQYVKNVSTLNLANTYETIIQPKSNEKGIGRVLGQADSYNPNNYQFEYVNVGNGKGDFIYVQSPGYYPIVDGSLIVNGPAYYKHFSRPEEEHIPNDYRNGFNPIGPFKDFVKVGKNKGDYTISGRWLKNYTYVGNKKGDYREYINECDYVVDMSVSGAIKVDVGRYNYYDKTGYVFVGAGKGIYIRELVDKSVCFSSQTVWDGFTVRNGSFDTKGKKYHGGNGGAGILFFDSVTIRNFVITNNLNFTSETSRTSVQELRGGAVFFNGGSLENCYVIDNRLDCSASNHDYSTAYGGGAYMFSGTAYNCVIARNHTLGKYTDGAGIFLEGGEFYNNTIVQNQSHGTVRGNGGICIWESGVGKELVIHNCISTGNIGCTGDYGSRGPVESVDIASAGGSIKSFNSIFGKIDTTWRFVKFGPNCVALPIDILVDTKNADLKLRDYRLNGSAGINTGENMPNVNGKVINLFDYTDMDYTPRVKDCTVDAGAYEFDDSRNILPDANGVYYVNFTGSGSANASSPENAACAMKLQDVLYAAGRRIEEAGSDMTITATVKIAGCKHNGQSKYNTARLYNPNDPQSYTFVIPYGVKVVGGYSLDFNEPDSARDIYTNRTVLTPVVMYKGLEVVGYHVLTFAPKGPKAAPGRITKVGGLFLEGGNASSVSQSSGHNSCGGAAIVPSWAHVCNCVITGCHASQKGGGLYLLPGAMVSGSLLIGNSAQSGGAIYAEASGASATCRSHIISNTIYANRAEEGGGITFEDGALMGVNCVVFGNKAFSDINISGNVYAKYPDDLLDKIAKKAGIPSVDAFYPFNNTFVETFELPSNYSNSAMNGLFDEYFVNKKCELRIYSPLIKTGIPSQLQKTFEDSLGIPKFDIHGVRRINGIKPGMASLDILIEAGASAFEGGLIPMPTTSDDVIKIIFVKPHVGVNNPVASNYDDKYLGHSFLTPLTELDRALSYIKYIRFSKNEYSNTEFIILMAGGVYKPSVTREDAAIGLHDQRENSFVVPSGVRIYGGFSGDEKLDGKYISYKLPNMMIDGVNTPLMSMTDDTLINKLLDLRTRHDDNANGIFEPWEFANNTILSGNINISESERNVYHVVYSEGKSGMITLDGLTVMDGETADYLSGDAEIGRGAGVFSDSVSYNLFNCRFVRNKAIRGNAVFVKDASLKVSGCLFGGNVSMTPDVNAEGGAICVYLGANSVDTLRILNSLFVNNEVLGQSGDGAVLALNGEVGAKCHSYFMNCIFARNKAANNLFSVSDGLNITNSVLWGNESSALFPTGISNLYLGYSACDMPVDKYSTINKSIPLDFGNMSVYGPRFLRPSAVAGALGFNIRDRWNPIALSVLVDAGCGSISRTIPYDELKAEGAYINFLKDFNSDILYNKSASTGKVWPRYQGRDLLDNESPVDFPLTIDIGLYEYVYQNKLSQRDTIYVDVVERGMADGSSWANSISSLDEALRALCMATGGKSTKKCVMVKGGEFSLTQLVNGSAFKIWPRKIIDNDTIITSLSIRGAYDVTNKQDYSKPTILRVNPVAKLNTIRIFELNTNGVDVDIDGICFGDYTYDLDDPANPDLLGIDVSLVEDKADNRGNLKILHSQFIKNDNGVHLKQCSGNGKSLFANVLFAKNKYGIRDSINNFNLANVKVLNATFVNNEISDVNVKLDSIFNSISYQNGQDNIGTDEVKHNSCLTGFANNDLLNGPNFVSLGSTLSHPDYRIRPGLKLLDTGSDELYKRHMGVTDLLEEKDLSGLKRVVAGIDRGAFEYNSDMYDTIYVKNNVVGDDSGRDWNNAMTDLQTAVDHAGVFAHRYNKVGVIMVHPNVDYTQKLVVSLGNIKLYGSMLNRATPVNDVKMRRGFLAPNENSRSILSDLEVLGRNVVVDGFEFRPSGSSSVSIGKYGLISTSVFTSQVNLSAHNVLYNSLVLGNVVGNGTVVNTTAIGDIKASNKINVIERADSIIDYLDIPLWRYQLHDTSSFIDAALIDIQPYIDSVGHDNDIACTSRIRGGKLDCGCFETWNLTSSAMAHISATDRPTRYHVVYVGEGVVLTVEPGMYTGNEVFDPGYLILKDKAELLANGNNIELTHFAVDRKFEKGVPQLVAMPFKVLDIKVDSYKIGDFFSSKNKMSDFVKVMKYDSDKRAAYNYEFNSTSSSLWDSTFTKVTSPYEGLLFDPLKSCVVRFEGSFYSESDKPKLVPLFRYNYDEQWSPSGVAGNKFTHAENMSWNLVGSPFLCTMNYNDMEYGRMIYKLNGKSYVAVNTAGYGVEGNVPVGTAFFTQTATLRNVENMLVNPRKSAIVSEKPQLGMLNIAVRNVDTENVAEDKISLRAVPSNEASTGYNMATDAVKMNAIDTMTDEVYIIQFGHRYSILDAIDIEGKVSIGMNLSKAGNYVVYIPSNVNHSEYDVVALHDALKGVVVDLKDNDYSFHTSISGEVNNRFSVTFKRLNSIESSEEPIVYSSERGVVMIENLRSMAEHSIWIYDVSGKMVDFHTTKSVVDRVDLLPDAVYLVKIKSVYDGTEMISINKVITK